MDDDVVTKDCIIVARRTDSPVAMATQNASNNTARDGQQQSKTSRPSKPIRIRVRPSPSTSQKQAVKQTPAATGSGPPTKGPQPSSSAVAAAKQLGLGASTGTASPSTEPSRLHTTTDGRPPKRHHDQAFPPSQQKKPEFPRRGAPPEFINQARFEIRSIHSEDEDEDEDEDASDSDEPLIESQKRRIASRTPSHSVAQAAQIQSLTQQLSKANQDQKNATNYAVRLQQEGEASKQAAAARIADLERENALVSEMNINAKVRYGHLQGRNEQLKDEYNQAVFDLNSTRGRFRELHDSNRQLQADVTRLQAEVARLQHRDRSWQQLWDERMVMEMKWRSDIMNNMNGSGGGGGGARR